MDASELTTPANLSRYGYASSARRATASTATKRDSFAAELERDPQQSSAKRQQRTQAFASTMAHSSLERQLVAAKTAKLELETKLRERDIKIESLESDRRLLADREQEQKEEWESERETFESDLNTANATLSTLRRELSTLREQHADLTETHSTLSHTTHHTIASLAAQLETATRQVEYTTRERDDARAESSKLSIQVNDLETELLQAISGNDTKSSSSGDDNKVVLGELERVTTHLKVVERKNTALNAEVLALRSRQASVEVLREEKRGLETQIRALSEMRDRVGLLEIELQAAKPSATPSKSSSSSSASSLIALRHANAKLLEEHGATLASVRALETRIVDYERRDEEASARITTLEKEVRTFREKVARRERRAVAAEREVAFLTKLVASLKSEQESINAPEHSGLESLLNDYKTSKGQLLADIDRLTADSRTADRSEFEQLQKELSRITTENTSLQTTSATLQETISSLETELTATQESLETTSQQLFDLQGEVAGGRHVPPHTRVLTCKDSPDQEWLDARRENMEKLKGENEALLKRLGELKEVQGSGGADSGLVPRESWESACREKEEMEEVLRQKEKRLLRLQQVFQSKSAEFRQAIETIIGFKLAFYPNGQVRVTSIYDLEAAFIFQPTKNTSGDNSNGMQMQLVAKGDGGGQDLPGSMDWWIEKEGCIPGFLATVTLECHDGWKRRKAEEDRTLI